MPIEPITHLEKTIAGTVEPVTHLEKAIAGTVEPVTHLEKIIDQYGGGGEAVLIQKTITANGTFAAADDNADGFSSVTVEVQGGDTLESDFLIVHMETVEVGENTVTNSKQYNSYLDSIKSIPGTFVAMSIHKKVSYTNNEWANGEPLSGGGYRFRSGSWTSVSWNSTNFDAVAPVGTLVDVYTVEVKIPNNV